MPERVTKPGGGDNGRPVVGVPSTDERLAKADALHRAGHLADLLSFIADSEDWHIDLESRTRLLLLKGMALFDGGDIIQAIGVLRHSDE